MFEEKHCEEWRENPLINPVTNRSISNTAKRGVYQSLVKFCGFDPLAEPQSRVHKQLKPHQISVVNYITKPTNKSILVVHDTGSGKTLTALASAVKLILSRKTSHVVIVAPLTTLRNWRKELSDNWPNINTEKFHFISFNKFYYSPILVERLCRNSVLIIDEVHNLRKPASIKKGQRVLYYPGIKGFLSSLDKNITKALKERYPLLDMRLSDPFLNLEFEEKQEFIEDLLDLDIPDDLLFIPSKSVLFSANLICALKAWKIIILTATPVVNSTDDMRNIFNILLKRRNVPKITLKNLHTYLNEVAVSYYSVEKNKDTHYPSFRIHNIFLKMLNPETIQYKIGEEKARLENTRLMTFYNALRRTVDSVFMRYYSPKIDFITRFLQTNRKKSLIYSFWIEKGLNLVTKLILKNGIIKDLKIITGKTNAKDRSKIIAEFNKSTDFSVLLISAAGREGIDLKGVRYVFLLEPGWNSASEHQALSRAIRYKSHSHLSHDEQQVDVYRLLVNDTIDTILVSNYVEPKNKISDRIKEILKNNSI